MKRTLIFCLCLMLTGCGYAEQPVGSGAMNQNLTFTPETTAVTAPPVSNTETTVADMTEEEKTVPTVRGTSPEIPDVPAFTEGTANHRENPSEPDAEATASAVQTAVRESSQTTVQETTISKSAVTVTTAAPKNQPPVTCSQTSRTASTVTTFKTTITTTVTEPEPPPQSRYDWNSIPMQLQIYLEEYEIDADALFEIGTEFSGTEYERACAVSKTAQNMGGRNCIEHALNAYFIGGGAGLNIGIARSTLYDWYGHVANAVMLDGAWYYMEPQGGLAGLAQTYTDGYYPDGLDLVIDIYGNQMDVVYAAYPYN